MLGDEYQVVLVGVSEEQKRTLPGNVTGITRTNSVKELAMIYSAADCAITLSKTESFSMVNLEAMCCGTPVITYDVGGSKESVEPAGGIVVKKGDLKAVAEAVRSNTARAEIDRESFDNERAVNDYVRIVQKQGGLER